MHINLFFNPKLIGIKKVFGMELRKFVVAGHSLNVMGLIPFQTRINTYHIPKLEE